MKLKLAPSMMCCNFFDLGNQVRAMEKAGVDLLHVDVMDGSFVPNLALGSDFARQLKAGSSIPLDLHFMVEEPARLFDLFPFGPGDCVSVHCEATRHLQRTLAAIRARGAAPFLALNPGTPVEAAADVLDDLDGLLLMTVNPGFAGQKMVPHSLEKIARARAWLNANGKPETEIEVDGNVSPENAVKMRAAGANVFVAGTSAVFRGEDIAANVAAFRNTVFA